MKVGLFVVSAVCAFGAGCQKQEEAKTPMMTNPGGKTANLSPDEAVRANQYEQAGARSNAAMEEAARKMREAQGGKR